MSPQETLPTTIGTYPVVRLIEETTKSRVYLCEDPDLKRKIVIKKLRSGLEPERLAQFRREGPRLATGSSFHHPNIPQVFTYGVDEDQLPFLAMEYVEGKKLEDIVKEGRIKSAQATKILKAMANAAAHLHNRNPPEAEEAKGLGGRSLPTDQRLIHHDIIPRNIIITEDERAVLVDFGSALRVREERYDDIKALGTLADYLTQNTEKPNPLLYELRDGVTDGSLATAKDIEIFVDNRLEEQKRRVTRRRFIAFAGTGLVVAGLAKIVSNTFEKNRASEKERKDYESSIASSVERFRDTELSEEDIRREATTLLKKIAHKYELIIGSSGVPRRAFPYNIPDGIKIWTPINNSWEWMAGFWPKLLWELSEVKESQILETAAESWTNDVAESHVDDERTINAIRCFHAYGTAYRKTAKDVYKQKALEGSRRLAKLATRDKAYIRFINGREEGILLDNLSLVNSPLLFAYEEGGDSQMLELAVNNGQTARRVLVNEDGSSIQCAEVEDEERKRPLHINGFAYRATSCFARAHVRGIEGFLELYRVTKNKEWLKTARDMTDYVLRKSPEGKALPYDFDDPSNDKPIDTASTAMFTRALSEQLKIESNEQIARARDRMVRELVTVHLESDPSYQGILRNGYSRKLVPKCGLIYGDEAFVQTLKTI
ncbi:MAG: protein kinase domain-containing protein [Candidatus Pacearchaeota archaeon]